MVRVLIADDQPDVRSGIRALLERTADIVVVGEAADGAEAVRMAAELRPDVVLMDVRMPDHDGIAATRQIVSGSPGPTPRVIVLTTFDLDEYVFGALREGASGFLTKNVAPDELRRAVRLIADGQALLDPAVTRRVIERFAAGSGPPAGRSTALDSLTPREREVARLVARGLTNEEISVSLFLSIWTVKTHVSRILAKLGARERAQIVIAMYEAGDLHVR
ncbi:response regulator transcription factor [Micromonospora sp. NPDC051296]|uniref:response regulator transcription factor n=1 Tax=Micromonospora sp. NPDC051296 TaxID=3155046 RepID=UPI003427EFA4